MNNVDVHPALLAALAGASAGPTEGVHVRKACGFAPAQQYVAEVTKMTPVGPIITRAHGDTPEQAVDAARARTEDRLIERAPAEIRDDLRNPQEVPEGIGDFLRRLLSDDQQKELLPGSEDN